MNRRHFLKNSSAAGLSITAIAVASCTSTDDTSKKVADKPASQNVAHDFELSEITIDELQQKMQSGEYTSRAITELYLKRIDAIDKKGPAINAVIEINQYVLNTVL